MSEFSKDLENLRQMFKPIRAGEMHNISQLADAIQAVTDLHGVIPYRLLQEETSSGTNVSNVGHGFPPAGHIRYVVGCSAHVDGGGPHVATIRLGTTGLVSRSIAADERLCVERPFYYPTGVDLDVELAAASGVGNVVRIITQHIDIPDDQYVWPR